MEDLAWTLFRTARAAMQITGVADILRQMCGHLDSQGAILWEIDNTRVNEKGRLFASSQWFESPGVAASIDDLPCRSKTWRAIESGVPAFVPDIDTETSGIIKGPFLQEAHVKGFISVPFQKEMIGALTIYRTSSSPLFTPEVLKRVQSLAPLVCCLSEQVATNVGTDLVFKVTRLLDEVDASPPGQVEDSTHLFPKKLCRLVADTFQSIECTLILSAGSGENEFLETTWTESPLLKGNSGDHEWRMIADACESAVAVHASSVTELSSWKTKSLQTKEALAKRASPDRPNQPSTSFMAAAILVRQKRVGTIYCFAPEKPPFFFSRRDLAVLQRVSVLIGRWWSMSIEARKQLRIFQDLSHQLKSPMTQIYHRAQDLLPEHGRPIRYALRAVLGLSRKSRKVVLNMRIFASLADGKAIKATLEPFDFLRFGRMAREAVADTQILFEEEKKRFVLDESSFASWPGEVQMDYSLIEQALNNLLDNAGKYSFAFENTVVQVAGKVIGDQFGVCIINRGIQLREQDIDLCKQRGWRSPDAEVVTGEGSGIGLWLVDHIMKAHRGTLQVIPTDQHQQTEVRLVFRTKR